MYPHLHLILFQIKPLIPNTNLITLLYSYHQTIYFMFIFYIVNRLANVISFVVKTARNQPLASQRLAGRDLERDIACSLRPAQITQI